MSVINLIFILIAHYILETDGGGTNTRYEVFLENVTECRNPILPFAKKRIFITKFTMSKSKDKNLLSGRHLVLAEVPFLNFSMSSYSVDAFGKENLECTIGKLTCRSWMSKAYLVFGNFRYSKKDCHVKKGSYGFEAIDFNKFLHSFPNWHAVGKIMHRRTQWKSFAFPPESYNHCRACRDASYY